MMESISPQSLPFLPQRRLETGAQQFEAAFLSQMLASAGAGKPAEILGGIGESQFASFLLDAQAEQIAQRGGIGIAETIIRHFSSDITKE